MSNSEYQIRDGMSGQPSGDILDGASATAVEGFADNPINFYRFLTPQDELGRLRLPSGGSVSRDDLYNQYKLLFDTYIKVTMSGRKIIEKLSPYEDISSRGVGYQTVTMDGTGRATFLDREYWITKSVKPSQSDIGPGQEIVADSYYQNICTIKDAQPDVDVTLNVLRMPLLNDARKNTDEISLFLNYMPPLFASRMVPYLDVEFQMPRMSNELVKDGDLVVTQYLQRPSILRFLLGSIPPAQESTTPGHIGRLVNRLTDVDAAFLATATAPRPQKQLKSPTGGGSRSEEVYITGMEMFTTPQTLTNMDSLTAGPGRLNDVKPFLPPASLSSVSMNIGNLGTNDAKRTSTVELKIHDKARLVEFSEFIRGPSGIADVAIWLTFGWLAPRGSGGPGGIEQDAYAKFVNETMLVRYPFTVKDSSFSFESSGIATLKLDLVGKAVASLQYGRIDVLGSEPNNIVRDLPRMMQEIKELRTSYTSKQADVNAAFGKDNKIYEIINAAEAGNLAPSIPPDELLGILKSELARLEQEKPVNQKAIKLIQRLHQLYEIDPTTKLPKIKTMMEESAKNFAKSRFDSFRREGEDPFLPSNIVIKKTKTDPASQTSSPVEQRLFSEDLVRTISSLEPQVVNDKTKPSSGASGGRPKYAGPPPVKGINGRNTFAKIEAHWTQAISELKMLQTSGIPPSRRPYISEGQLTQKMSDEIRDLRIEIDRNNKAGGKATGV